jgi:uncharacterized protein with HEPN domain
MTLEELDRIRHRRDAAATAVAFAAGKTRTDLETDLMFQFATVRALEIIGEAAARLPDETRAAHPEIPWSNMIGMRNRLVHGYFDVDLDIVWNTVDRNLSPLIGTLNNWIAAALQQQTKSPASGTT